MDVMMPGLDGPSTFKRMRDSPLTVNIPVIFMTAKVMPEEIALLLELGAIGVIGKPFDSSRLCDELFALWKNARTKRSIVSAHVGRSQVQTQVVALSDSFLARARNDVGRLREMIERARLGEQSALKEVERVAHSIHGAGAMFGFPKVSASGGAIERLVAGAAACTGVPRESNVLKQLLECTTQLAHELDAATETASKDVGMFQV
jgi:CheY-like chemotaxis protein